MGQGRQPGRGRGARQGARRDQAVAAARASNRAASIRKTTCVHAWTHRLGYVVPSWNTVVEYETTRMLPAGVSAHFSRITHIDDSPASLRHMAEQFPAHVELLSHAKVDAVCYACTGASLF